MTATTRLNKFLALHLGISRREADIAIEKGRVTINNQPAQMGHPVHDGDTVSIDGKPVSIATEFIYVALHKPVNYVCSRRAQGDNDTVYSLLDEEYQDLKLVGRLDKNSSGIILLTNDGDFAFRMTHPKFKKTKVYEAHLKTDLQPLHRQMISDYGVILDDGKSKFELERLDEGSDKAWRITMSEGRNRQIRRTFSALGYTVSALHRTHFGPYALGNLPEGQTMIVTSL